MNQLRKLCASCLLLVACMGLPMATARGQFEYTPDSPEVEEMVWRAVEFLRSTATSDVGPVTLRALAISEANLRYRQMIPTDDPLIQSGIAMAMAYTRDADGKATDGVTMYATGVCSILLSLFGDTYRDHLQSVLDLLAARQQVGGSWGYQSDGTGRDYGDTSQMQYCCLAMWVAAKKAGLKVNPQMAKHAIDWLIETQTGSGGWVYRASRPGGGSGRGGLGGGGGETLSLTAAGCGSVYMLADILGATPSMKKGRRPRSAGLDLPIVVQEFVAEEENRTEADVEDSQYISAAAVRNTTNSANNWFKQNFRPNPDEWRFYYLYGFERYAYFREAIDGQVTEVPDWYDQGVKYLMQEQGADGSFRGEGGSEAVVPSVSTAFAILFLVRSTELLANESLTGTVQGGQGFGSGNLSLRRGQIVNEQLAQNVEDFLKAIESGKELDLAQFSGSLSMLKIPTDPGQRAQYMQQLRVLVNDENFDKRFVAVRFLSSVRELDNVPALIYAMTDPAPDVVVAAHNGLRFISRKIDSIQLPDNPNRENVRGIKEQWEKWYLSVRPDADLMYEPDR